MARAWSIRLLSAIVSSGALLLVQVSARAEPPDACAQPAPETPSVYLGAWVPAALDVPNQPLSADPLGRFQQEIGRSIAIVNRWEHWGPGPGRIDPDWLGRVAGAGAVPMVTWVPWNPDVPDREHQTGFLLRDIAAGNFDGYISSVASNVAGWNGPLFIRFAQEMNGTWYPWGKHQNAPSEYIATWRHVHELFDQQGATQVTWVWNPSEKNHPETMGFWYPGSDVVDWVAVDGYNWDDPRYWRDPSGNTWRTLDMVFGPSFADIATFAPDRPWMIAETATTERPGDPGMKAAWICDAFRRALPQALPNVKAVMWFDQPTNEGGEIFPWQIDSSGASREAFAAAVASVYYVGSEGDARTRFGRAKVPPPGQPAPQP